jgi:DNA-binding CsgD family transcriptional regulator/tetratricopeptide (TPR) repeat protein
MVGWMLLERDAELAVLTGLVDGLDMDIGKVVLIRGEAGIGKSALVRAFAESVADRCHVLFGTCDDLFIPQPLSPFWDMARSEPSLREPLGAGDRPRLLDAAMALLSRSLRPTVLVLEDTHWADEATLDAIRYLGRRIARSNGLMLLTYRDGEVDYDHPLRGVIGDIPAGSMVRMNLTGLSVEAVSDIVGDSRLDPEAVLAATRGNPLLVTEMAADDDVAVPTSLQDTLVARLQRLTIGSQELLKVLSVIPEPIPGQDALRFVEADEARLEECQQHGFLDLNEGRVGFRHELIRRTIEASMSQNERLAKFREVLERLPDETHPCLLIHCAAEVRDIDRLLVLAPRSARYAARAGSHVLAAEDFRELGPYLDRVGRADLGPLLAEWADEEFLVDEIPEAIRISQLAREHYRAVGDHSAESRTLARAAHYHENAGQRDRAEELGLAAIEVLGSDPDGRDLARALEVNAYLQMMAGNVTAVPDLVERTLEAGGPDIDTSVLIRSLNHKGIVANIANYPSGRSSLDEARKRAEAAGQWYEESRALLNHAWAAAESRDLPIAADYARRAIASAERHQLRTLEVYSTAMYARILELEGAWDEAADLARDVLSAAAITQMVALPILGVIDARRGQPTAHALLRQAWEMAVSTGEIQRLAPAAIASAEGAWISGVADVSPEALKTVMDDGLALGFKWSSGEIASWLWRLGELMDPPAGIAEPYRLLMEGEPLAAAAIWERLGVPYQRALALMHGEVVDQLEAVEVLEALGATTVAAKLRKTLRDRGVTVGRGKARQTRSHAAGLTARQAEVLQLLGDDQSNTEIADRLFISPRTAENHVAAVLDKLGAASRDEAVSRARADGLLGTAVGSGSRGS